MRPRSALLVMILAAPALGSCAHGPAPARSCAGPGAYQAAATYNAAAEHWLTGAWFGREERGWAVYTPRISTDFGTACPAASPGFARAAAAWQARAGLSPTGAVDPPTLLAMKAAWQGARPFVAERRAGICPDPPAEDARVRLPEAAVYPGAEVRLETGAAKAFLAMRAAAVAESPAVRADPRLLSALSGWRDPASDAARCVREGGCDGTGRASCSAHRTGTAVDIALAPGPAERLVSTDDLNREVLAASPAYRWLVANAARFGFVNYVYEPWHWEWTGASPAAR